MRKSDRRGNQIDNGMSILYNGIFPNWSEYNIDKEDLSSTLCANTLYKNLHACRAELLDGSIGHISLPFTGGTTGFLLTLENNRVFDIHVCNNKRFVKTNQIALESDIINMVATIVKGLKVSKNTFKKTVNDGLMAELNTNPTPFVIAFCMLTEEEVAVHASDYLIKLDSNSEKAIRTVLAYGEMMEKSEEMLFCLFKYLMENNKKFPTNLFE